MTAVATVYLIPSFLEEESLQVLPDYITQAVKVCEVFFVENERSARRFLKKLWKEMEIDRYPWFVIHKTEDGAVTEFLHQVKLGRQIGILSEAGCPGIADPGQVLVAAAHAAGAMVKPLVGPSSILLALMASGMNGQQFQFNGYLPVDAQDRNERIKELETLSRKQSSTQIFIETPYRNQVLLEALLKNCKSETRLCVAVNLTGKTESILTKSIEAWRRAKPALPKQPAIFLINAGS
ncbi:MAG: SAM-dependent methyltransferase [Chitinophagales bacterium]